MRQRWDIARVGAGILASVLLHAALIMPLLVMAMSAPARPPSPEGRFHPDDLEAKEPPLEPRDPMLGIDADTQSTFTWVGYEAYEKHLAELADVEQAAFTTTPPSPEVAEAMDAAPAAQPEPVPNAAPAESTGPGESEAKETPEPTPEPPKPPSQPAAATSEPLIALPARDTVPAPPPAEEPAVDTPSPEKPAPPSPPKAEPKVEEKPEKKPNESPREVPKTPKPTGPAAPPPAEPAEGDPSDKESDATSIIEVPLDQIKRGKPIARPGLELKPRRPRFTLLTQMTAAMCNPVVRIQFKRDGKPKRATVIKTACNRDVDNAIENSLYGWRASGKQLEALKGDETLDVELTIVLRPTRKRR